MRKSELYIWNRYGSKAMVLFLFLCFTLISHSGYSLLNVTANGVAVNNLDTVSLCITQNGDSIQFQTTGVGGAQTVNWVFNSALPNTATGVGPHTVHYTGNNSDTVFVTLLNAAGNVIDLDTIFVITSTLPNASINPNDTLFCKNDPLYTVNGLSPNNGILSGAGISNGKFNPNAAGVGSHWITYTRSNGICSSSDSVSFTVIPAPTAALTSTTSAPVIVGGVPLYKICTQLLTPQTFAFTTTNSSNFDTAVLNFGDGSSISFGNTITNQTHSYANPGVYTVTLTVTKNNGCVDTEIIKVFWGSNPGIGISTSGNTTVCLGVNGSTFTFPITPSSVANNPPGTIYVVTFNDGSPSQVYTTLPTSFTHTFTTTSCGVNTPNGFLNSFYVKITASNPCGSSSSTVEPFVISEKPESDFTMPDSACKDVYVDIENNSNKGVFVSYNGSNYSCDSTVQIIWDINPSTYTVLGGSSNLGSLPSTWTGVNNPQVKFTQAGTYDVSLYIKSQYGTCGSDTITKTICIDSIPDSTFNLSPDTICSGNNVFAAYNSGLVGVCDSIYLSWDITPDTTSYVISSTNNDSAITWNFNQSGIYDVTLTRQHYCDTSNYTLPLVVEGPPTLYLPPGENICGLDTVNFADSLKAPIVEDSLSPVSYQWLVLPATGWNYSAGSFPSSSNPKFNFTQYGMYTITLIVSNSCGADTQSIVYTFNEFPVITPIADTLICYNYDASLTASATSGTPGFQFYWGALNGSITDTGNVLDLFNLLNDTSVYVMVEDFYQCTDSMVVNVLVSDELIAEAGVDPYSCYYDSVQLQGSVQGDTGAVVYSWIPTTGLTNPNISNPIAFPSDTNNTFYLTVTDSLGCFHTDSVEINIYTIIPMTAGPDGALCLTNGLDTLSGFYPTSGGSWSGTGIVSGQNVFNPAVAGIGAHNIVYSYTDGNGCSYTDTAVITVISQPTANFGVTPISGCGPLVLTITDSSSAGALHNWDTNGVAFSTVTNPSLTVTNSSVTTDYNVSIGLVIIAGSGCSDTTQQNVTVYPTPNANFTIPLTICALDTLTVIDGSVFKGATATYHWAVNSSSVWISDTTAITPDFVFADNQSGVDSVFTVTLTITSVDGCTNSYAQNITIYSRPVATFSMPVPSCSPVSNSPVNSSTGVGNTYSWSVSPSITITGANTNTPTFNFPLTLSDSVVYQITLNVLDSHGCMDEVSHNYTIYPKPSANFTTVPDTGCSTLSVNFTNSSTSGQTGMGIGTMSFLWDFGNGTTSTSVSPSQSFTNSGIIDSVYFTVLISSNAFGCTDTLQDSVTVHPDPISNMVITATANCAPFLIDSTVVSATVYPAANSGYSWTVFDTNLTQLATFTGATAMNYTITAGDDSVLIQLITSNTFGCSSDTVFQWFSTVGDPEANFGIAPDSGCSPLVVTITDSSTVGVSYLWSANGVQFSTVQNPPPLTIINSSHISDSIVYIQLDIAAGALSCSDSTQKMVTVYPTPKSNFGLASTCALDTVMAIDSSIFKGTNASYLWSTSSPNAWISNTTIATPSFVFGDNQSGVDSVFSITLMVTSVDGCTDTITKNVTIYSRPLASFAMPASACSPIVNSPINNSTGGGLSYNWTVNPSISIAGPNLVVPSFSFPLTTSDSVMYQIKLAVTNANGCTDSMLYDYWVYPKPNASFSLSTNSGCGPLVVHFTNTSTSGQTGMDSTTMSFQWDFGNGNSSINVSPTNIFTNTGVIDSIYTVTLISTNAFGCQDTIQDSVTVHPNPLATLNFTNSVNCAPFLLDSSVISAVLYPNANSAYNWTVFDTNGTILSTYFGAFAMNHTIINDGDSVLVQLITTNSFGCANDTATQWFSTIEDPVASFGVSPDTGCSPLQVTMTDSSTVGVTYSWTANGVPFSSLPNPLLTITNNSSNSDSVVVIQLIITAGTGCLDTAQQIVTVYPKPVANFSLASTCALDTVVAIDSSDYKGVSAIYTWTTSSNSIWISDSTVPNPSFVFPDNQSGVDSVFTVTLTVTSIDGCVDVFSQNVTIFSRPVANFSMPISACSPVTNSPTNNSTGGGNTYSWNVSPTIVITGSNSANPIFNFPLSLSDSVVYQIFLSVTDSNGCTDETTEFYTVFPKPNANFVKSVGVGCEPLGVNFTNSSTSGQSGMDSTTMTFLWDFGNGITTTVVSPSQNFSNTGVIDSVYYISLISTNAFGCMDTITDSVVVHPNARAEFSSIDTIDCAPFVIDTSIVTGTPFVSANNFYYWLVYDLAGNQLDSISGLNALNHTILNDNDTLIVKLITESMYGCESDTASQMFITIEDPVADFSAIPDTGCTPLNLALFDSSTTGVTYEWFVDGSSFSVLQNPTLVLTNSSFIIDSTYTIELIITAGSGCKDTALTNVVVQALPNTNFSFTNVCDEDSMSFFDQTSSVGNISDWQWDFGNGMGDSIQNPMILYATFGVYNVILTTTDVRGCVNTFEDSVTIYPNPIANFNTSSGCLVDTVCLNQPAVLLDSSFVNSLGAPVSNWQWDIGYNGVIDYTLQSPTHTFVVTGNTDVHLLAQTQFGCTDTITKTIFVSEPPTALFQFDTVANCGPLNVNLINQSSGLIVDYLWTVFIIDSLGNPFTIYSDTTDSPTNIPTLLPNYYADSTYYFSCEVSNCCGSDTMLDSMVIKPLPVAGILASTYSGCTPLSVMFQLDGQVAGNPDSLILNYGDGTPPITLLPNYLINANGDTIWYWGQQNHVFVNPNPTATTFTVTLTAINECADSTVTVDILVYPNAVQAFFQATPVSGCEPLIVQFQDYSVGGTNFSWCFDYDTLTNTCNQPVGSGSPITNIYPNSGTYTVALFVDDGCGYDTAYQTITVDPSPNSAFTSNNFVCSDDTIIFINQSTISVGFISSYLWDFGDGITSTLTNPIHQYAMGGTYNVSLVIFSSNGCSDTSVTQLTIYDKPNIDFSAFDACFNEQPVQFNDSSSVIFGQINGTIWQFGDGNSSTNVNPQHTYANPGLYNVWLTHISTFGCIDSAFKVVNIYPEPTASFTYTRLTADSCVAPQLIQFNNNSSNAQGYFWDFDYVNNPGMNTSTLKNPTYQFNTYGTYHVALFTTNQYGCSDSIIIEIKIQGNPVAGFYSDINSGCNPIAIQFTDTSFYNLGAGNIAQWIWNFGNGDTTLVQNPLHEYTSPGIFDVSLIVITDDGCSDTITQLNYINVDVTPEADFNFNQLNARQFRFNNQSLFVDNLTAYHWNFGDTNTSVQTNPIHRYNVNLTEGDASFMVCLKVSNITNCTDSTCQLVEMLSLQLNVPNALAPEEDMGTESNVFLPKGHSLREYNLRIYDKWGNIVFQTTSVDENGIPNEPWDGTNQNNGIPVPMGSYSWRIDAVFNDGTIWQGKAYKNGKINNVGSVTVVR